MNPSEMQRKAPPRRRKHHNRAPLTGMMSQGVILEKQMKSPHTKKAELPTWAQLKKLTLLARKSLASTKVTQTSEKMLLAALMVVSTVCAGPVEESCAKIERTNKPSSPWHIYIEGKGEKMLREVRDLEQRDWLEPQQKNIK
ncbi:endogenous retrovirus group K member 8 Rec protein-like [Trachypithecus francoisi]|uniref:endogenous retrovirus group K member 8 Rec protein-like n=1 Tax=Trachypithecus francoisi TaxID=54180 RepID=UPI00141B6721|nr:endogenous retrovirus group K member 8 Rec protein-like [Trachypithecus francoisi]